MRGKKIIRHLCQLPQQLFSVQQPRDDDAPPTAKGSGLNVFKVLCSRFTELEPDIPRDQVLFIRSSSPIIPLFDKITNE